MKINTFSHFNTEFKGSGLYRHLKKELCSKDELVSISDTIKDEDRSIGCLPKEWLQNIESGEIGEKTKQVHKILADFSELLHSFQMTEHKEKVNEILEAFRYKYFMEGHSEEETRKAVKNLEDLIKQKSKETVYYSMKETETAIGDILNSDCEIDYINSGSFGTVFKVTVEGKACALKIFKLMPGDNYLFQKHGEKSEIAGAVFLNKNIKPSQCAKFYLGRFSSNRRCDGYMLTGYVEKPENSGFNQLGVWNFFDKYAASKYTVCDFNPNNVIGGKLIDFGGVMPRFKNETQIKIAKELFPMVRVNDREGIEALRKKYNNSADFLTVFNIAL